MSSPAVSRGLRKGLRTLLQTIAGGGLTALVTVLAGGLSPQASVLLMAVFTAITALAQNGLEASGKLPILLPTPSLIPGPAATAVATVEATADQAGEIVGDVLDTASDVVGTVTGQLDKEEE
jgi:hypothetical protein